MRRHSGVVTYVVHCVPRRLWYLSLVRDGQGPTRWRRPRGLRRYIVPHRRTPFFFFFFVHRHSVVRIYSSISSLATCIVCIGSEGRAAGRRVGAGREACTGTWSLTTDRLVVHRHGVVSSFSGTLCLPTITVTIVVRSDLLWVTMRMLVIVRGARPEVGAPVPATGRPPALLRGTMVNRANIAMTGGTKLTGPMAYITPIYLPIFPNNIWPY